MTQKERENWQISIRNTASYIESQLGPSVVSSVLQRYGYCALWELSDCDLPEVFSELHAIDADLR